MMKTTVYFLLSALMLCIGITAQAATIDTSAYSSSSTLLDAEGSIFYDGLAEIFEAEDLDGILTVDAFAPTDASNAALDTSLLGDILSGAAASSVMAEMVQFLFVDGITGYLVTLDATGAGVDFTDATSFIDTEAQITLQELSAGSAPQVPLPASWPLLAAGLCGLIGLRARRES